MPTTGAWAGQAHIVEIAARIMAEAEAAASKEKGRLRSTSEIQKGSHVPSPGGPSEAGGGSLSIRDSGLQLPLPQRDSFPANSEILLEAYRKLAMGGGFGGRLSASASLKNSPSISAGGAPTPTWGQFPQASGAGGGGNFSPSSPSPSPKSPGGELRRSEFSERLQTGESLTGTSPFAFMFDLEGGGPSTSLAPSPHGPSTDTTRGYGGEPFNQSTQRGGGGTNAYEGYTDALQARMGGKVADLPLNPEVEFELDWARDIVVFRDSLLGAGATGLVYRGLYMNREVAIKVRRSEGD